MTAETSIVRSDTLDRGRRRFVGRHDELAEVTALLDQISHRRTRCFVVEGEAGIGKTRLLEESLAGQPSPSTDERALRTAWLHCTDQSLAPQADLEQLLHACLGPVGGAWAVDHLAESGRQLFGDGGGYDVPAFRASALSMVANRVLDSAEEQPLVIVVDDFHWVHAVALQFLESLIDASFERQGGTSFGVLMASRPLPTDHPAANLLNRIHRSAATTWLHLNPLERAEVDDVIRGHFVDASPALLSIVHRSAGGNPLKVRAVVDLLARPGDKPNHDGADLHLAAPVRLPLDGRDPVVAWLEGLPADDRMVLGACAVIGGRFTLDRACAVIDLPRPDVAERVDGALRAGILATDGVHLWFAHPSYRELLYDSLGLLDRQSTHARCAIDLAETAERSNEASAFDAAIGQHVLAAGDQLPDVDRYATMLAAGDAALAATAWNEAIRFYLVAVQQRPDGTDDDRLHWRLGQAFYFERDTDAAEEHLRLAVEEASRVRHDDVWCTALVFLTRVVNSMRSQALRTPTDRKLIANFLSTVDKPLLQARVTQVLAEAHIGAGFVEEGVALADDALALARQTDDDSITALSHFAKGYAEMTRAAIKPAAVEMSTALDLIERTDDWYIKVAIQSRHCFVLLAAGRLDDAATLATETIRTAIGRNEFAAQALGGAMQAAVSLLRGDFSQARRHYERAASAGRRSRHNVAGIFLAPIAVRIDLALQDPDRASAELAEWTLPSSIQAGLSDVIDLHRGDVVLAPTEPTSQPRIGLIGAGLLALRAELALAQHDRVALESAADALLTFDRLGLVVPPNYPVLLPRVAGDINHWLGRPEEAAESYRRALGLARRSGAVTEQVRVLLGLARVELSRTGATRDRVHHLTTQAADLAARLALRVEQAEAEAIRSSSIDAPKAVAARGGTWRVVMATDLVASTTISNTRGDVAYHQMVREHHELVEAAVERFRGHVFQDSGDGLYAWFDAAANAVAAARAVVLGFESQPPSPLAPQVKVGLAGGDPFFSDGRPYGLVVNRTARVVDCAEQGEVLVDEPLSAALPPWATAVHERLVELKGIGTHRVSKLAFDPLTANPPITIDQPTN